MIKSIFLFLGLLYESCVEFCQRRALSSNSDERSTPQLRFGKQEKISQKAICNESVMKLQLDFQFRFPSEFHKKVP